MSSILTIPEIVGLDSRRNQIRIPPETDVPLTPRVRAIIDTAEFRRLARISQLGLVALVYPAAIHTRFEHSLGVYRLALHYLKQLSHDERFRAIIERRDAELFIAAALLHDLGHWPFCHPLEDIKLAAVPRHEVFAKSFLLEGKLGDVLRKDWDLDPAEIMALLSEKPADHKSRILNSMLSGPIDIDKMDYLPRDSLHAGVPYGRNFDQSRLIGSLCLNESCDGLAITEKGKTAAEMIVFSRYVMFSEVYWHHGVRSATAMLQRAFFDLHGKLELDQLLRMAEAEMIAELRGAASGTAVENLLAGLFGAQRRLYKRVAQFSFFEDREIYQRLARRPYGWLVRCAAQFASIASEVLGEPISPHEVIFDAPPVEREVEFNVDVYYGKENCYRRLGDVSPVVRALAEKQFDDFVKRVRLFANARLAHELRGIENLRQLINQAVEATESSNDSVGYASS
ncbi:MAG: HD domain-containing protein [Pirellulales bacterium]|nr:HD domain-containing protein [Pirellulales bacterium]